MYASHPSYPRGGPAMYLPRPPPAAPFYQQSNDSHNGSLNASPVPPPHSHSLIDRHARSQHHQHAPSSSTHHTPVLPYSHSNAIEFEAMAEMQRSQRHQQITHRQMVIQPTPVHTQTLHTIMQNAWAPHQTQHQQQQQQRQQMQWQIQQQWPLLTPSPPSTSQHAQYSWNVAQAQPSKHHAPTRHEEKREGEEEEFVVRRAKHSKIGQAAIYSGNPMQHQSMAEAPMMTPEMQSQYMQHLHHQQMILLQQQQAHQMLSQQSRGQIQQQFNLTDTFRPSTSPLAPSNLSEIESPRVLYIVQPPQHAKPQRMNGNKAPAKVGSKHSAKQVAPAKISVKPPTSVVRPQTTPMVPKPAHAHQTHAASRMRDAAQFASTQSSPSPPGLHHAKQDWSTAAADRAATPVDPFPPRPSHLTEPDASDNESDVDQHVVDPFPSRPYQQSTSPSDESDEGSEEHASHPRHASASPSYEVDDANDAFVDGLAAAFQPRIFSVVSQQRPQRAYASPPASNQSIVVSGRPPQRPSSGPYVRFVNPRRASDQGATIATMQSEQPQQPLQRPRTTHGRTVSNPSATATRPSSRVGSASFTRPRPGSSNLLLSPRSAAREAAEIFRMSELGGGGSASPPPAAVSFPPARPVHPPSYTLDLSGSRFYSRLPDELWVHAFGFLDASSLLSSVARLDRASARLVSDQEVWTHVGELNATGLASTRVQQPDGPDAHLCTRGSVLALNRLVDVARRWTLLRSLDLSSIGPFIRDELFIRLQPHPMPYWSLSLRELSMAKCTLVTDLSLQTLAPFLCSLESLDLSWCALISDQGFEVAIRSCGRSLKKCTLNRCHGLSDAALGTLARYASALQELDLTFCTALTDKGLELLAARESKCFYPVIDTVDHGLVTHSTVHPTLTPVTSMYPGLQTLSLRWCRQITDAGIRSLVCGGLTPDALETATDREGGDDGEFLPPILAALPLPTHLSQPHRHTALRTLNLDHCSLLTDRSMMFISKQASQMRNLSAVYCRLLTPVSFQYLVSGSTRHLRRLVLDHCDHFHSYLCAKNVPTLCILLASSVFQSLELLSWKTCPHAGMERSRHQEIEAECCTKGQAAPSRPGSSRGMGIEGSISAASTNSDGNVLDWLHKLQTTNRAPTRVAPPWKVGHTIVL